MSGSTIVVICICTVYDSPINYKGWIQEFETIKLTKDNVKQVQGDVFLREGTPIYEVVKFDEISSSSSTKGINAVTGEPINDENFLNHPRPILTRRTALFMLNKGYLWFRWNCLRRLHDS